MKNVLLLVVALSLFLACSNSPNPTDQDETSNTEEQKLNKISKSETPEKDTAPSDVMLGTWTGEMNEKQLTLVIEKINGTELIGYNILGSNKRSITGNFTDGDYDIPCSKAFQTTLNEPGDQPYDGVFTIKFVGYEDEEVTDSGPECVGNLKGSEAFGTWKLNKQETEHEFELVKQQ